MYYFHFSNCARTTFASVMFQNREMQGLWGWQLLRKRCFEPRRVTSKPHLLEISPSRNFPPLEISPSRNFPLSKFPPLEISPSRNFPLSKFPPLEISPSRNFPLSKFPPLPLEISPSSSRNFPLFLSKFPPLPLEISPSSSSK